ncbi:MAG TPA: (2Fe-2S) ferredoxin domain-containing protein [Tepidisphaeraceae bacterium]|nr:(2Fe-2S) ferredoxin domain-containing protein [Tepidisphaeraceae bacterium]
MADARLDITICMGSSCFSRGNNRNIEVLRDFIDHSQPRAECNLVGHLCQDLCKHGPNIIIDGSAYKEIDPVSLMTLLNHHLAERNREK